MEKRKKEREAGGTKESVKNENKDSGIANMYNSAKETAPKTSATRKELSGKKTVSDQSVVTKADTVVNVSSADQIKNNAGEDNVIEEKPESSTAKSKPPKRQDSDLSTVSESDSAKVTMVTPPVSASTKHKQQQNRRPLPGQSQYKVPGYKQTSRACEIS